MFCLSVSKIRLRRAGLRNVDAEKILSALEDFFSNPYFGDIEKIEGEENTWRRRVGNYRIIYDIDKNNKIISVRIISRRASNTY